MRLARSGIALLALSLLGSVAARESRASTTSFDESSYIGYSAIAQITVADSDLNTDPFSAQTVVVTVVSSSDQTGISVFLFEDGVNSPTFSGGLGFTAGDSSTDGGVIRVAHGDNVAAIYQDLSPFEPVVGVAVWFFYQPGSPSPTNTPVPPTETPTRTPSPTRTPLPLFTPVPLPTQPLPRMLLVDDDGSPAMPDVRGIYEAALQLANLPYDLSVSATVTEAKADQYQVLVWFTGGAFADTLEPDEQEVLEHYLDEKRGKLLFSSQDHLYEATGDLNGDVNGNTFAARFLGVSGVENDRLGPSVLVGVQGTLSEGMQVPVQAEHGYPIEGDWLVPSRPETVFLRDQEEHAVALMDVRQNSFSVAFFAFPLDSISAPPGPNDLSTMLRTTICAGLFDCGDPKAAGRVTFNKHLYNSERDQGVLTVFDANRNTNPLTKQKVTIGVNSTLGGAGFVLDETGPNTGIFDTTASGKTLRFSTTFNDGDRGILLVFDGDSITVGYGDNSPGGFSQDFAMWFESPPATPTPTRTATPQPTQGPPGPSSVPGPDGTSLALLVAAVAIVALRVRHRGWVR